jgi:hypothetical protein
MTITCAKIRQAIDLIYQWEGKDIRLPSYEKVKAYYIEMYGEIGNDQEFDDKLKKTKGMCDGEWDAWLGKI